MHFFPNSSLFQVCYTRYDDADVSRVLRPRNINYMPAVKNLKCLDLRKNCYSRTASS